MTALLTPELAGALAAVLIGALIKGTIGFGMPVVAMSLMAAFMPVEKAAALMVFPIVAANIWQAADGGHTGVVLRRFWPVMIALAVGIVGGAVALAGADPDLLLLVLALAVLAAVILDFSPWRISLGARWERPLGVAMALVSGAIGGVTTSFGLLLTVYLTALRLPREVFVATIGVLWTAGSLVLLVAFSSLGVLTGERALQSAVVALAALAGMRLGRGLRRRIDERLFRRLIFLALTLLALNLIRRSVF